MKKIALVMACVLALCIVPEVLASGCVVRQRVVNQAVVVDHAAVVTAAVFAPVPVYVPQYSVGYAGPDNTQLLQEIQALRREVADLRNQRPQPLPELAKAAKNVTVNEHPAVEILRKNCAACHSADMAKAKGAGFTLFDVAGFASLTDKQALAIARNVYSGRMPKGGKLSDEEVGQVMSWLDTLK